MPSVSVCSPQFHDVPFWLAPVTTRPGPSTTVTTFLGLLPRQRFQVRSHRSSAATMWAQLPKSPRYYSLLGRSFRSSPVAFDSWTQELPLLRQLPSKVELGECSATSYTFLALLIPYPIVTSCRHLNCGGDSFIKPRICAPSSTAKFGINLPNHYHAYFSAPFGFFLVLPPYWLPLH